MVVVFLVTQSASKSGKREGIWHATMRSSMGKPNAAKSLASLQQDAAATQEPMRARRMNLLASVLGETTPTGRSVAQKRAASTSLALCATTYSG